MKKRSLITGFLALEILCLPAAAQMVDHVSFKAPQKAISVPMPTEAGHASFVVMSNAAFTIVAMNATGDFDVKVTESGLVNGKVYGENAQLPGDAKRCSSVLTSDASAIYRATKKTASKPGEILTQAVMVDIRFDPNLSPKFDIQTEKESRNIPRATPCLSDLS